MKMTIRDVNRMMLWKYLSWIMLWQKVVQCFIKETRISTPQEAVTPGRLDIFKLIDSYLTLEPRSPAPQVVG